MKTDLKTQSNVEIIRKVEEVIESLPKKIRKPISWYEWDYSAALFGFLNQKFPDINVNIENRKYKTSIVHTEYPVTTHGSKLRWDVVVLDPLTINDSKLFNEKKILVGIETKIISIFEKAKKLPHTLIRKDLEKIRAVPLNERPVRIYFVIFDEEKDKYENRVEYLRSYKHNKIGKIFYFTCGEGEWIN